VLRPLAGIALAVVLVAAGCSSGHSTVQESSSESPKQAAIALGLRLLDDAEFPIQARPSNAAPSQLGGPSLPGFGNLESAHRTVTIAEDPRAVYRWLQQHAPRGFKKSETSTGKDGDVPVWGVEDDLSVDPPNCSTESSATRLATPSYGLTRWSAGRSPVRSPSSFRHAIELLSSPLSTPAVRSVNGLWPLIPSGFSRSCARSTACVCRRPMK
jgi:hypothetical protein